MPERPEAGDRLVSLPSAWITAVVFLPHINKISAAVVVALVLFVAICLPTPTESAAAIAGKPLNNLTEDELKDFRRGEELFRKAWSLRDGLGPLMNAQSCAACHHQPRAGGSG